MKTKKQDIDTTTLINMRELGAAVQYIQEVLDEHFFSQNANTVDIIRANYDDKEVAMSFALLNLLLRTLSGAIEEVTVPQDELVDKTMQMHIDYQRGLLESILHDDRE